MAKKKATDKVYVAPTNSDLIARIQALLRETKKGHFPWATVISHEEMRFLYDLAANAETTRGFQPTTKQSVWGISIIKKIDLARQTWKAAHGTRSKMPSAREDLVARQKAKEKIKRSGHTFSKSSPSNYDLAVKLHEIGAISVAPTKGNATEVLIEWRKRTARPTPE